MKITKLLLVIVIMICLSAGGTVFAEENLYTESYAGSTYSDYYDRWLASNYSAFEIDRAEKSFVISSGQALLHRETYQNFRVNFEIMCTGGSGGTGNKQYVALRQPKGYGIGTYELELLVRDDSEENKRPGDYGIFLGVNGNEIEIILHTVENDTVKNVLCSVPLAGNGFGDVYIPMQIEDRGDTISIFVNDSKLMCSISVSGDNAAVYDADNNKLIETNIANIPQHGAIAFASLKGSIKVKNISFAALGTAAESAVTDTVVDKNLIHVVNETNVTTVTVPGSTNSNALIVVISVAAGVTVLIWVIALLFMKSKVLKIAVPAAATVVCVVVAVVFAMTLKTEPTTEKKVYDSIYLNEDGNTISKKVPTSNQTAEDLLGRVLPGYEEVGGHKEGKYVGMYYALWLSDINSIKDNTKLIACNPDSQKREGVSSYYWSDEPETGYHTSSDEWQIRRDLYYLSLAGVDYIHLDFTNGYVYPENFELLLETSLKMREEGNDTPQIVPWIFADDSGMEQDIGFVYRQYYSQEKYKSLWFYWDGKPLVLLKPVDSDILTASGTYYPVLENEEMCDFFTFRFAWVPGEGASGHFPDKEPYEEAWGTPPFMHGHNEEHYSYGWVGEEGNAEAIALVAGGHIAPSFTVSTEMGGRSGQYSGVEYLDKFQETETMQEGLWLQYQFDWAMETHPEVEVLCMGSWNEWVAQYLPGTWYYDFTDSYNREFSRDIEPAKGPLSDCYYYQLCILIRRFKGVDAPDASSGSQSIKIDGSFSQWESVEPAYTDFKGDTTWRDATDPTGTLSYVNHTGRNDIVESRVAYDSSYMYFYAKAADTLTSYTDKNWMLLFIDADCDKSTGWEGYDYMVNYEILEEGRTVVCKWIDNVWQEVGMAVFKTSGSELHIQIPRATLGFTDNNISFNFHWMDNVSNIYDLNDWFTTGDSAPERRNNYVFTAECVYLEVSLSGTFEARNEGKITYMKPWTESGDGSGLSEGLGIKVYTLVSDYGKQPELQLLDANLKHEGITDGVKLPTDTTKAFAVCYEGYIYVEEDGVYSFTLTSDDGSLLYINNRAIIDNSGVHTVATKEATIGLEKGYHKFRIEYFENGNGNSTLSLKKADGISFYTD